MIGQGEMKIYIYIYTNISECLEYGWSYIGVSNNLDRRVAEHMRANTLIGNKLRKYDFGFDILNTVDNYEEAYEFERFYIEEVGSLWPHGYNLESGGRGGKKPSEESKQKMRASHIGLKPSEESKRKIGDALRGRKKSEEVKKKIGDTKRGKKRDCFSKDHKRKICDALRGRKKSEEHTQKNR